MPWGGPYANGRSVLLFTLATSNVDFFGDLLYFAVNVVDGGYQHASLTVVSFAAFVAPAVAFALRNGFFSEFVATGRTITPTLRNKLDSFRGPSRVDSSLPSTIMWLVSRLLLLGLAPLLLLLWTLLLLGTLIFGVNMKLFALSGFLRIYRQLLSPNRWQQPSSEEQVVALNEALFFELALESVPEMCVVIINEILTPGSWSSLAIVALGGSGFFVLCLLWKFADRIRRKGFREGLRVPVLACTTAQSEQIKKFMSLEEDTGRARDSLDGVVLKISSSSRVTSARALPPIRAWLGSRVRVIVGQQQAAGEAAPTPIPTDVADDDGGSSVSSHDSFTTVAPSRATQPNIIVATALGAQLAGRLTAATLRDGGSSVDDDGGSSVSSQGSFTTVAPSRATQPNIIAATALGAQLAGRLTAATSRDAQGVASSECASVLYEPFGDLKIDETQPSAAEEELVAPWDSVSCLGEESQNTPRARGLRLLPHDDGRPTPTKGGVRVMRPPTLQALLVAAHAKQAVLWPGAPLCVGLALYDEDGCEVVPGWQKWQQPSARGLHVWSRCARSAPALAGACSPGGRPWDAGSLCGACVPCSDSCHPPLATHRSTRRTMTSWGMGRRSPRCVAATRSS